MNFIYGRHIKVVPYRFGGLFFIVLKTLLLFSNNEL